MKTMAGADVTKRTAQRGKPGRAYRTRSAPVCNSNRRLSFEYVSPQALALDPDNPRVHSERQLHQIAGSIEAFGFNVPILINATGRVIAGHGRVQAARSLGIPSIPAIRLEHLTSQQLRAFAIADNKLTENAQWNEQLLAEQLKMLSEAEIDFTLEAIGFETAEVDLLIEGLGAPKDGPNDPADQFGEAESAILITKPGDLWGLGRHRVICADALDQGSHSKLLEGRKAAAVFTDPPYNVRIDGHASGLGKIKHREFAMAAGEMNQAQFAGFLTRACALLATNSASGSLHYVCMDWRHLSELLTAGEAVYSELKALCVWNKGTGGMGSFYRSQHELIFVFKNGTGPHHNNIQLGRFGRYRTNVWDYPGLNSFARTTGEGNLLEFHPTTKPVALVSDAIMDCSERGDIILDSFLGSGTTVIAAERTGRCCYGIEIDPAYVDTIIRRWQAFTGLDAVDACSGQSFNELEQEATSRYEH
jgi:DNA modification methylase